MDDGRYVSKVCVAVALALSPAVPTYAQNTQPGNAGAQPAPNQGLELTEIIVTARRVEERLQDVPISITVFNQEQVSNRNLTNVQDLAIYTPSLSSNPTFGAENASLSLRGFVQDTGTAPTVGTYFADVPVGRAAALT